MINKNKSIKHNASDFNIIKLEKSHLDIINKFNSYEKDLVDFLIDDAFDNQEKNISITYLWFLKKQINLSHILHYLLIL